jgi:UDP-glucose 4-epimerase
MEMAMRILVTGGNGYVGRVVTRLLYDKHAVCVADCLHTGQLRFRKDELRKVRFERIDITEQSSVVKLMSDFAPEAIIHLAAIHYIPECEEDPAKAVMTNVNGTVNMLLAAPPESRFVYASSGAVYRADSKPHQEATGRLEPSDVYGLSKLHGEQYVRYFALQRRLAAVIVRLFNVIGPGETNPHVLPEIVAQLKAGRTKVRLGNLRPRRDYVHVGDAARGFVATALNGRLNAAETLTVNLGTSQSYSVADIIRKLRRVARIKFTVEPDPNRFRAIDRPFLAADIKMIRRLFGWQPAHTMDESLKELWQEPDLAPDLIAKYR